MSEDSFLREVEDELRSEKLRNFWRRYAPFIIGAAVLIVVGVAGNEAWKWWRSSTAANASDQFYSASALADQGDIAGAQAALNELAESGPSGYATLARFRSAALLAEQGDAEGAIAAYDALSASLSEPRLRELALVLAAHVAVDTADVGAIEQRVGTIAASDGPLRNQAREAMGLAAYNTGDLDRARSLFEDIAADPATPQELQLRAFLYLEHLASQGVAIDEQLLSGQDEPVEAPGAELPVLDDLPTAEEIELETAPAN